MIIEGKRDFSDFTQSTYSLEKHEELEILRDFFLLYLDKSEFLWNFIRT